MDKNNDIHDVIHIINISYDNIKKINKRIEIINNDFNNMYYARDDKYTFEISLETDYIYCRALLYLQVLSYQKNRR